MKTPEKPLLGLYIHWPYCLSKCPYCDFASLTYNKENEEALMAGYIRDIATTPPTKTAELTSIFLGGGTPSLMHPHFLERLLQAIQSRYTFAPNIEISLEANPDAINSAKMRDFASLGVNRLSIGVQSLNETDLHKLGRLHSVQTALKCLKAAQKIFPRTNMDLIYARPEQTINDWKTELQKAIDLGLTHYSLYQLTIEQGTAFYKQKLTLPDEDTAADLYELTNDMMNNAGIPSYEVSNYAALKNECLHNLTYWKGADYIGIGPSAHGRIGTIASENKRFPTQWLKHPTTYETLSEQERFTERVLMGLRLTREPFSINGLYQPGIEKAIKNGWIELNNKMIKPTLKGTLVLDTLVSTLLP